MPDLSSLSPFPGSTPGDTGQTYNTQKVLRYVTRNPISVGLSLTGTLQLQPTAAIRGSGRRGLLQ